MIFAIGGSYEHPKSRWLEHPNSAQIGDCSTQIKHLQPSSGLCLIYLANLTRVKANSSTALGVG